MGISTHAAPKRCCSGFWTEFKWLNFNWNNLKQTMKQKPIQKKIGLKSNKQMRTSARESRDALWGHIYYVGFESSDHLIPFFSFQIPDLNLALREPQNQSQPQNPTPPLRLPAPPLPQAQPGWAFLAPKRGKKILSNSKNISSAASSSFPDCRQSGNSYISWAGLFSREWQPVCLSVCSSRGCVQGWAQENPWISRGSWDNSTEVLRGRGGRRWEMRV